MKRRCGSQRAFTLVELVVALVVLSQLALILAPAMQRAPARAKSVRCLNNLKIIGRAALLYAHDNNGTFHTASGVDARVPNHGKWNRNPSSTNELSASDLEAYWGVAYRPYSGRTKTLWRCPSARVVDEWREEGVQYPSEFWLNSTYGLNKLAVLDSSGSKQVPRSLDDFPSPSGTVFAQDAAEQAMEGPDDSLGLFPGKTECLTQWKHSMAPIYPEREMEREWFRHPTCNTVWVDGHVSGVGHTKKGIDYRHYTGEKIP
jgi:prepilin-type N-terminal cleavage/methylation domain-containing protein/prepilin-type processing-associated H-X9-DG protein